jgi:uncharacterized protein (TIGR02001 family)
MTTAVYSDYRSSASTQTNHDPALQLSLDYAHLPTGLYASVWGSNVSWIKDMGNDAKGPVEVDLYLGKTGEFGDGFRYDGGLAVYFYPGNNVESDHLAEGEMTSAEAYGLVGYGPVWLKYTHAITDASIDPGSKNSKEVKVGFSTALPYDFQLKGAVGYKFLKTASDMYHWLIGVSYTFEQAYGITIGMDVVGNSRTWTGSGKAPNNTSPVFYLSKTFVF